MLPIRDLNPSENYPVVNNTIIGICIVVFIIELSHGANMSRFLYNYGLVPARYTRPEIAAYFPLPLQVFSFISFMFLHGGFFHLIFNMWFLYVFGDNIEDDLGHGKYLLFYLLCGLASGVAQFMFYPTANVPTVGASGAIAGVMGAYLIRYPAAKVLTLVPLIFIPFFFEVPAFFFLGLWFLMQVLNATMTGAGGSGVAWWAHVGGFVAGIALLKLFGQMPTKADIKRSAGFTAKRKTPRLQIIRPSGPGSEPDLHGELVITQLEGITGTTKTVNIPWGFQSRLYRVVVPPGTRSGAKLRLKGLGRQSADGTRGDLLLKVIAQ
ncbi:MAG: rhomboid family intramembrane serine protease [Thermodesulfobacteriota bacterium]|nr:rhomboid family intramembrane serine protease [Thermodesulfobacteriota bacterium]